MQAETRRFAEQWRHCAVQGLVIQIRGESILFKPRTSTHSFWLDLQGLDEMPIVGSVELVVNPAVFDCKRIIPRHGDSVKVPLLECHSDELDRVRGRLAAYDGESLYFELDLGFPVVITLLEACQEIRRARLGEILELELAPPAQGHLVRSI